MHGPDRQLCEQSVFFFCAGRIYERRHHKDKHPGNATQGITYSVYMTSKQGR